MVRCKAHFDILNDVSITPDCDGQTNRQQYRHSRSKCRVWLRCAVKNRKTKTV